MSEPVRRPIRRVMVAMDLSESAAARARFAASLATAHGADLVGAAATAPVIPAYAPFGEVFIDLTPEIWKTMERGIDATLNHAEAIFRRASCLPDAGWRRSGVQLADRFLAAQCADADILVVGRRASGESPGDVLTVSPSDMVMTAGRPVIVTPPGLTEYSHARVVIGWKSGREARRALADALPLIAGANEVVIAVVGDESKAKGLEQARDFLDGHGIGAVKTIEPLHRRRASDALMDVAERVGATLLVTGAYGQSRLKEWALGGMTRDLLDRCPVACLMSH